MKKLLAVLLTLIMVLSLAACKADAPTTGEESKPVATESKADDKKEDASEESGEVTKLIIYMAAAANMEDAGLVAEKVNEYIRPLINAEIELNFVNIGSYAEQVSLMIRSGEQIDAMLAFENDLRNYIRQDAVTPLDDLLEKYGDGIIAEIGEENMAAAKINGSIYSLPALKDMAMSRMLIYDKQMAETAGVDLSNVKTMSDLTEIYAKVKEVYPDCSMFGGAGGNARNFDGWDWDNLSDSLGVLMNYGEKPEVVNLFETDYYMELCQLMHEWYEAGYIEKDFATSSDTWTGRMQAGTAFSAITSYKPGNEVTVANQIGKEIGYIIITEPLKATSNVMNATWLIPATTVDAEKTMQFLQLMYTDPTVANLVHWGIEGVHYEENEDGTIGYIDAENNKYQQYLGWALCNQFITKVQEGNNLDVYEATRAFNDSGKISVAFGFAYDSSNVVNEITACNNVLSKYRVSLECGEVDPVEVMPKFIEELKDAGIDKIVAEKQTQLDAWLASK